jgi:hypothetical protein
VSANVSQEHAASIFRITEKMAAYVPPKYSYPHIRLHGVVIQKTTIRMLTAVKTSYLAE